MKSIPTIVGYLHQANTALFHIWWKMPDGADQRDDLRDARMLVRKALDALEQREKRED